MFELSQGSQVQPSLIFASWMNIAVLGVIIGTIVGNPFHEEQEERESSSGLRVCRMIALALGVALWLVTGGVSDVQASTSYPSIADFFGGYGHYPTGQGYCDALSADKGFSTTYNGASSCTSNGNGTFGFSVQWICPYGGIASATWPTASSCTGAPDCSAGQVRNTVTGVCRAACTVDQTVDPVSGECRTACVLGKLVTGSIPASQLPGNVCSSGCEVSPGSLSNQYIKNNVQVWWGSWTQTGSNCTGTTGGFAGGVPDPPQQPATNTDPPTCGVSQCLGQFNGRWSCQSCGSTIPPKQITSTSNTTNSDGSSSSTTTTTTINNNSTTTTSTTTNTSAGGTPAGTTTKTDQKPGGTNGGAVPNPDIPTCGYPGGPPCKIDESGTSSGSGAFDGAKSAIDDQSTQAQTDMGSAGSSNGKDTSIGTWPVPTGSNGCQPIAVGEYQIDICTQVPLMRDIVAWLWYVTTFWVCWGMVKRAQEGA